MAIPDIAEPRATPRPQPLQLQLPLAPSLERRRLQVYLLLMIGDAVAIVLAFMLAAFLYYGTWLEPIALREAQVIVPFYWAIAIGYKAYSSDAALDPLLGARRAALSLGLATALVVFIAYFLKSSAHFARVISALGTLLAAGGIIILRDQFRRVVVWRCGPAAANRLVIHDGGRAIRVPHSFAIEAGEHGLVPDIADPHALNRIGLFLSNMDQVIVACAPERRKAWALVLKGANIQGEIVDDDILELGAIGASRTPDYAALVIAAGPLRMTNRVLKRLLDLGVAVPAVIVAAPLLLLVALAIKLEDGGPVLFVQRRLGRGNRFFPIYKFRSMREGDPDGTTSTARRDPRITRVGRLIRATSIDELPQLFNVIRGEMSLVGPRPHALGSQAGEKLFWEVDDRYWQRHSLKPGLTGLAQVRGLRGATAHERDLTSRLQSDLEYLDGWTIGRDLAILFATLGVLVHRNAY